MTWLLIKLGIRLVVFLAVFFIATKRNPNIVVKPRWALPVIAGFFALVNTALYWALKPVLNLASFGAIWFLMPFVLNLCFLIATVRVFQKSVSTANIPPAKVGREAPAPKTRRRPTLEIDGIGATLYLAGLLTLAHGVLWFAVDWCPAKFS